MNLRMMRNFVTQYQRVRPFYDAHAYETLPNMGVFPLQNDKLLKAK